MSSEENKPAKKYPFIAFRPNAAQEKRIRRLSKITDMTVSEIVNECISAHLPHLENHLKSA